MAVLVDALRARTGGELGAASLPRHLRRRATSHNPYHRSTKHRPNMKRRRLLEQAAAATARENGKDADNKAATADLVSVNRGSYLRILVLRIWAPTVLFLRSKLAPTSRGF